MISRMSPSYNNEKNSHIIMAMPMPFALSRVITDPSIANETKTAVSAKPVMVITQAVQDSATAWYFGDDMSDIRAFEALRARESVDPGFFGMAVAVANDETGAEVSDAADLTLASPEAVAKFVNDGINRF